MIKFGQHNDNIDISDVLFPDLLDFSDFSEPTQARLSNHASLLRAMSSARSRKWDLATDGVGDILLYPRIVLSSHCCHSRLKFCERERRLVGCASWHTYALVENYCFLRKLLQNSTKPKETACCSSSQSQSGSMYSSRICFVTCKVLQHLLFLNTCAVLSGRSNNICFYD